MKNNFSGFINNFIHDLEEASPVTKAKLKEIYPIKFKISLDGHKDIFISLDEDKKEISFSKVSGINFEIRSTLSECISLLINKKINKEIIFGDIELAIVFINSIIKSDIDLIFLIDKYLGNFPAAFAHLIKEKLFIHNQYNNKSELQSKLRSLSIRLDRLEAMNNL